MTFYIISKLSIKRLLILNESPYLVLKSALQYREDTFKAKYLFLTKRITLRMKEPNNTKCHLLIHSIPPLSQSSPLPHL